MPSFPGRCLNPDAGFDDSITIEANCDGFDFDSDDGCLNDGIVTEADRLSGNALLVIPHGVSRTIAVYRVEPVATSN